jgi:hypothetical protein
MKTSRTAARIATALGTICAFVVLVAPAQASSSRPGAMSTADYRALMTRSEALNARYGNAVTRLSPQQFKSLWEAGGDRLEPQELVALVSRSAAINHRYRVAAPTGSAQPTSVVDGGSPAGSAASAFDWSDFGIGAAAMLGLLLLGGGLVAGSRYGRRASSARVS